jgi:hypothetical protein
MPPSPLLLLQGFAFAEYATDEQTVVAMQALDGAMLGTRRIAANRILEHKQREQMQRQQEAQRYQEVLVQMQGQQMQQGQQVAGGYGAGYMQQQQAVPGMDGGGSYASGQYVDAGMAAAQQQGMYSAQAGGMAGVMNAGAMQGGMMGQPPPPPQHMQQATAYAPQQMQQPGGYDYAAGQQQMAMQPLQQQPGMPYQQQQQQPGMPYTQQGPHSTGMYSSPGQPQPPPPAAQPAMGAAAYPMGAGMQMGMQAAGAMGQQQQHFAAGAACQMTGLAVSGPPSTGVCVFGGASDEQEACHCRAFAVALLLFHTAARCCPFLVLQVAMLCHRLWAPGLSSRSSSGCRPPASRCSSLGAEVRQRGKQQGTRLPERYGRGFVAPSLFQGAAMHFGVERFAAVESVH